jgi:hypothetical protein
MWLNNTYIVLARAAFDMQTVAVEAENNERQGG